MSNEEEILFLVYFKGEILKHETAIIIASSIFKKNLRLSIYSFGGNNLVVIISLMENIVVYNEQVIADYI